MINLPAFVPLEFVRKRLSEIFPESFPDRSILVSEMAARLVFVALYGAFIEGEGRFFRPSTIIRFGLPQSEMASEHERLLWMAQCQAPGYKATGQWYADNTREPLRDDLIRNRAIPMGLIRKREGVATTSPAPIYCLSIGFAALFNPLLSEAELAELISRWQDKNLDPMVLQRMRLLKRTNSREGDVSVVLPSPTITLRLSSGDASVITRDVCESLFRKIMIEPVVVHVSTSEQKFFPELAGVAKDVGLNISAMNELPDIVAVDKFFEDGLRLVFVEVVHSDGPITELRKKALLKIAAEGGIPESKVRLITAFEDRNSSSFKKRISEIARGSDVWFRSEPELLLKLESIAQNIG